MEFGSKFVGEVFEETGGGESVAEGGDGGGMIVAEGTPEDVAGVAASHTGTYLARMLAPKG